MSRCEFTHASTLSRAGFYLAFFKVLFWPMGPGREEYMTS